MFSTLRVSCSCQKKVEDSKYFPGCFDFSCSGHVESGEDYAQAAIRELEEELGIRNEKLVVLGKLIPKDGVSCFMKIYELIYDREIIDYDKTAIEKLCWFDLQEIEKLIVEDRSKFREDLAEVFSWYTKKYK